MNADDIVRRLDAIDARLQRLEAALEEARQLRQALAFESDSRRALAEQATWLVEMLAQARQGAAWHKPPPGQAGNAT